MILFLIPLTQRYFYRFLFLKKTDHLFLAGQFSLSTCTISEPFRSEKGDRIFLMIIFEKERLLDPAKAKRKSALSISKKGS